jgi:hypothetical protein
MPVRDANLPMGRSLEVGAIMCRAAVRELVRPGSVRWAEKVRGNARGVESLAGDLPEPVGPRRVGWSKMKGKERKQILLLSNPRRLI